MRSKAVTIPEAMETSKEDWGRGYSDCGCFLVNSPNKQELLARGTQSADAADLIHVVAQQVLNVNVDRECRGGTASVKRSISASEGRRVILRIGLIMERLWGD